MRLLFLLALAVVTLGGPLPGAEPPGPHGGGGTYRGRVLTERFVHRQAERGRVAALRAEQPAAARPDSGDLAILDTSGGVVAPPNAIDVEGFSIRFAPAESGYTVEPEPLEFDEAAVGQGLSLALDDDDTVRVDLRFPFPYFGRAHTAVWVNSDGNLTFDEGDGEIAARTLARAASGPPRIAPMFADLDPSRPGARVRADSRADRLIVTWDDTPQYSAFGLGRRQTFQAELLADGRIAFHYRVATIAEAVAGLFPGRLAGEPAAVKLTDGTTVPSPGGLAEIFQNTRVLDTFAVGQQFYRGHDDAYDFLIVFNNFGLSPGPGVFAFEINVRNSVLGIGDLLSPQAEFDYGADFGSPRRLESFVNMGPLSNYPDDPGARIPIIGDNTTLSLLAHETGHRWGVYVKVIDPTTGLPAVLLLGREDAHWNFFYHSHGSVIEGSDIEDRGAAVSPRYLTGPAVARYGPLDEYLMGLRSAEETPPSFVVVNPRNTFDTSKGRRPATGATFDGDRAEIDIAAIVAAEGPRRPGSAVAQREFRYAFALLVDAQTGEPPAADLAKLERIRREWEEYFAAATGGKARAETALLRSLSLSAAPAAGVLSGGLGLARVGVAAPVLSPLRVRLSAPVEHVGVPAEITIPAGQSEAVFAVRGFAPGVVSLTAEAESEGYERATARIRVEDRPARLTVRVESGDGQAGPAGGRLALPIVVSVRDSDRVSYIGAAISASTPNGGTVTPERAATDADGLARFEWRLGPDEGPQTLRLSYGPVEANVRAEATPRPAFSAEAVVNAASFNLGPAAMHRGLAPGGLATIFGAGLASGAASATEFPLPRRLGGTEVRVNGAPVPLLFVSPGQINFQMPFEVAGPEAEIRVTGPAGVSETARVPVAATQPGLFVDAGSGFPAALYATGGQPVWTRPARPGEFLMLYATGLGALDRRVESGEPNSTNQRTLAAVGVLFGERRVTPTFAGAAPGFAGLNQVNIQVPTDLPPGRYELSLEADGRRSNAGAIDVAPAP